MNSRGIATWVWIACSLSSAVLSAAEPPVSAAEVRALLQRLEKAEAKIGRLEEELAETRAAEPRPYPGQATALFEDAPAADQLSGQIGELLQQHQELQASHNDLTEKYDGLSQDYKKLSESHTELSEGYDKFAADIKKGKGVVLPGASTVTMRINARIHADYWAFPHADDGVAVLEGTPAAPVDPQDRMGFRRIRLSFRGDITDNMAYRFDPEIANPRDFEWRDAFIAFKHLPVVQTVQIGNQKRPYGLDHLNSSNDNIFLERPMIVDFINEDARRLGVQSWNVSEDKRWNWQYGVFNGDKIQDSDDFYVGDHYQMEVAGRLANTWWYDEGSDGRGYAHWAVSGTVARPDGDSLNSTGQFFTRSEARTTNRWIDTGRIAGAEWYELIGMEQVFNAGPLQLVGEMHNVTLQREGGNDLQFWGGYGYVAYMLTGEHMAWNRDLGILDGVTPFENFFLVDRLCGGTGSGWGAWQVAAKYSYLDATDGDILGGVGHNGTLGLVWYFNENAKLQFNWEHGWITDSGDLNAAMLPEAEYDILGMRCLIAF